MLTEWFECKVRYDKTLEDGIIKRTMETYLVDAFSFTEAEKRFIAEIEPFVSGEYRVTVIKRAKISELFDSDDSLAERWFKAKVAYVNIDEKTGKEKRAAQTMMVQAIDLRDAVKNLDKGMAGTLGDYVIVSVAETKIMDVFRYKVAEGEEA
jgi:hypothetical protein